MPKYIICASLFFVVVLSCTKASLIGDKYITLKYNQTQCSDPWGYGAQDSVTLKKLGEFLAEKKLFAASAGLQMDFNPGVVCQACTCLTGKVFYVSTFDNTSAIEAYAEIGFK